MKHQIISTSDLYFSEDNIYLQKKWYKELYDKIDAGETSFYDDSEVNPLWDNHNVKYSPDRKRLLGFPSVLEEYDGLSGVYGTRNGLTRLGTQTQLRTSFLLN